MIDRAKMFEELLEEDVISVLALTQEGWQLRDTNDVGQAVFRGACLLRRKARAFEPCIYITHSAVETQLSGKMIYVRWFNPFDGKTFCTSYSVENRGVAFQAIHEGIAVMEDK
jgi:hypothetical protein